MYINYIIIFLQILPFITSASLKSRQSSESNETRRNLDWKAPEEIRKRFPYYVSGYDYDNRAILVVENGKWNSLPFIRRGGEDLANLNRYMYQFAERIGSSYFAKTEDTNSENYSEQVILILDYEGLSADRLQNLEDMEFTSERMALLDNYYEKIHIGFIINANAITDYALSFLKPSLGRVFEKLEVYGTESKIWIPRLLHALPQNQLKLEYGGFKDFKPVATFG